MSALLCIECQSVSAANAYEAEAATGSLAGVDLGTTSDVIAVYDHLVVRCTETRAETLMPLLESVRSYMTSDAPTVTKLDIGQAMFYALGQLDAQ